MTTFEIPLIPTISEYVTTRVRQSFLYDSRHNFLNILASRVCVLRQSIYTFKTSISDVDVYHCVELFLGLPDFFFFCGEES